MTVWHTWMAQNYLHFSTDDTVTNPNGIKVPNPCYFITETHLTKYQNNASVMPVVHFIRCDAFEVGRTIQYMYEVILPWI